MAQGLPPDRVVIAPGDRRDAVLDVIRQARSRLALSLFRCNDKKVFEELSLARARGVEVEVLMTARAKGGQAKRHRLWAALQAMGVQVRAHVDPVVKYHAKYLVADDGPALVASLNFTRKCFRKTIDAIVITHDPSVVTGLRDLMHADRESLATPDHLSPRLVVGPENARRRLTEIIEQAAASIRVIDAKATDPSMTALLGARSAAGVRVDLYSAKRLNGVKSHGRIMLVDDRLCVIGGLSLNPLSLDFRREVALTVDEPSAVEEVVRLFASLGDPAGPDQGDGTRPEEGATC